MDKTVAIDGHEMAQRPYTQKKGQILITLVLSIIVLLSLLQFNAFVIDAFPLNRFFSHHHSSCQHNPPTTSTQDFQLVSIHRAGVGRTRNQVYQILNIPPTSLQDTTSPFHHPPLPLSSMPRKTTCLTNLSRQYITNYMTQSRLFKQSLRDRVLTPHTAPSAEWITHDIPAPNITDKLTVTTMAKVASNAYIRIPETEDWYDIGKRWNESNDFGWEEHGLRGHVFANKDNSTIIVALKGTSPPFVGGSDTATNDKINVPPPSLIWF
jgi:lipase ATG15